MESFNLLIDGQLVAGDTTMPVINPATEETIADCPRASLDQLNQAVAAAKAAFPAWAATPIGERRKAIARMADAIEQNTDELARILTREQGKPLADATGEVQGMAGFFRYFATLDLPVRIIEDSAGRKVEAHRRPLGVIGAIVPWNYPLLILAFKLPPALLAGNTIVVKPAPTTPLSSLRFAALIADVLPKGVINFITDANDLGDALTHHPDVRKISFTGSTATGRKVMASAAETLKRITLELGGNDAGVVLDDANPATVAKGIFNGAFQNSGQVCLAIKRLYGTNRSTIRCATNWRSSRMPRSSMTDRSRAPSSGRCRTACSTEGQGLPRRRPQERQDHRRRRCRRSSRVLHPPDHRA